MLKHKRKFKVITQNRDLYALKTTTVSYRVTNIQTWYQKKELGILSAAYPQNT